MSIGLIVDGLQAVAGLVEITDNIKERLIDKESEVLLQFNCKKPEKNKMGTISIDMFNLGKDIECLRIFIGNKKLTPDKILPTRYMQKIDILKFETFISGGGVVYTLDDDQLDIDDSLMIDLSIQINNEIYKVSFNIEEITRLC